MRAPPKILITKFRRASAITSEDNFVIIAQGLDKVSRRDNLTLFIRQPNKVGLLTEPLALPNFAKKFGGLADRQENNP
jgi:hypothetical protein